MGSSNNCHFVNYIRAHVRFRSDRGTLGKCWTRASLSGSRLMGDEAWAAVTDPAGRWPTGRHQFTSHPHLPPAL